MRGIYYYDCNLIDDLYFSHVIQISKENLLAKSQKTLRYVNIFHGTWFNGSINKNPYFELIRIDLFDNKAVLHIVYGKSINTDGFKLVKRDSIEIIGNDLKSLIKTINKIPNKSSDCRTGDPWLIEYRNDDDYARLVYSYECHKSKPYSDRKESIKIFRLLWQMEYLASKNHVTSH